MEKSSVLKECPRCGLKNRSGTGQCDFCGWDLNAAADEWMSQIADLQKVSAEGEPAKIDGHVRSRIELTIKDVHDIPVKERPEGRELEVPPRFSLEEPGDILTAATLGGMPEPVVEEPEPETEPAVESVAEPVIETAPEPLAEPEHALPSPAEEAVPAPAPAVEPIPEDVGKEIPVAEPAVEAVAVSDKLDLSSYMVPAALLIVGLAAYIGAVYLTSVLDLSRLLGWGMAIAGSATMVAGGVRMWPLFKKPSSAEDEVVLCPSCHEVVTDSDRACPSCGVEFKKP